MRGLARPSIPAVSLVMMMLLAPSIPSATADSGSHSYLELTGHVLTGDGASFVRGASVEVLIYDGARIIANLRYNQLTVSGENGTFNFTVPAPDWAGGFNATLRASYAQVGASGSVDFALSTDIDQSQDLRLPWNRTLGVSVDAVARRITTPRDSQANFVINVTNAGNDTDDVLLWAVPRNASIAATFSPGNHTELQPGRWQLLSLVVAGNGLPAGDYQVSLLWRSAWFAGEGGRIDLVWNVLPEVLLSVAPASVSWSPDPLYDGDHASLECTVANLGRDPAPGANVTVVLVHPAMGQVLRDRVKLDVPALGCATASFPWTAVYSTLAYRLTFLVEHPLDLSPDDNSVEVLLPVGIHNTPPTVAFTSPANASHLVGNISMRLSVTDPDAASPANAVYLRIDGGSWQQLSLSSPVLIWDTAKATEGWHTLEAYATDAYSQSAIASITVKVENKGPNHPPEVYVDAPLEGDVFLDSLWASGGALDQDGPVERVEVRIDSGPWAIAQGTQHWAFQTPLSLPAGAHGLHVRAFDGIDYSRVAAVNFTVTSAAPTGLSLDFSVHPVSALPAEQVELRGEVKYLNGVRARDAVAELSGPGVPAGKDLVCDALGRFVYTVIAPGSEGTYTYKANCSGTGGLWTVAEAQLRVIRPPNPDLTISSLAVTGSPRAVGVNLTVVVDIRNLGTGAADCDLVAWEGQPDTGTLIVERPITVYESLTASFVWMPSRSGSIVLTIELDGVSPSDANLTNNKRTETVTIVDVPDIVALQIVPSNLRPNANTTITIVVSLANDGGVNATCDVELFIDGHNETSRVAVDANVLVPAHGKAYSTLTWTPTQGHHALFAQVGNVHPDEARADNDNVTTAIDVTGPYTPPQPKQKGLLPGLGAAATALSVLAAAGVAGERRRRSRRPQARPNG